MYNLFLVLVLYAVLASEVSWTLSISNKDLDELESLIKAYKRTATKTTAGERNERKRFKEENTTNYGVKAGTESSPQQVEAAKFGLQIMAQAKAKRCGIETRLSYEVCNKKAVSDNEKQACASIFVEAYQKCYFGDTLLKASSKDLMYCSGSCLWNFDNCLVNSNRVEIFICINARNMCSGRCPWPNNIVTRKRSSTNCNSVCEGKFDQCYDAMKNPEGIFICNVNRFACRQSSYCTIEE